MLCVAEGFFGADLDGETNRTLAAEGKKDLKVDGSFILMHLELIWFCCWNKRFLKKLQTDASDLSQIFLLLFIFLKKAVKKFLPNGFKSFIIPNK